MKTYLLAAATLMAAPALAQGAQPTDIVSPPSDIAPEHVPTAPPATTASLATDAAVDGCELHVWPAERMASSTSGLLGGGLLDAMIHSGTDANNKTLLASALDSPSQLNALTTLDLRTMLGLTPGTMILGHPAPLERKTMNSVKTRRSDSTAACYSELIVADVFYQKSTIYGRSLRTLFLFRQFDPQQKITWQYKAWGGNGLSLFPPKEGENTIAALDELTGVYKKNFDEYAGNLRKAKVR